MKTATIIAAAAAATFATAPAALADDFAFDFTYEAEKLETIEGAQEILDELEAKVTRACQVNSPGSRLIDREVTATCVDETMDNAIQSINSRQLSAAYGNKQQS